MYFYPEYLGKKSSLHIHNFIISRKYVRGVHNIHECVQFGLTTMDILNQRIVSSCSFRIH